MAEILIFPVGGVETAIVEFLTLSLPENLNLPTKISDTGISLEGSFDVKRRQYYSTKLLERILAHHKGPDTKLLGIVDADLYIPPLSFVFGEAQLDNVASIVSIHRLRQEFYGLPEDSGLLYDRCEKEAIHELGHNFGLVHCRDYQCVMYLSYAVEDIDLKNRAFCPTCDKNIRSRF